MKSSHAKKDEHVFAHESEEVFCMESQNVDIWRMGGMTHPSYECFFSIPNVEPVGLRGSPLGKGRRALRTLSSDKTNET
jgi:hypothetical protein